MTSAWWVLQSRHCDLSAALKHLAKFNSFHQFSTKRVSFGLKNIKKVGCVILSCLFSCMHVSLSQNSPTQRPIAASLTDGSLRVPKAVPTNIAYESHLRSQFSPGDNQCVKELLRLRREGVLSTNDCDGTAKTTTRLSSLVGSQMASVLEDTVNLHSIIEGFAPPPSQFVEDHIDSLMGEFVHTEVDSEEVSKGKSNQ